MLVFCILLDREAGCSEDEVEARVPVAWLWYLAGFCLALLHLLSCTALRAPHLLPSY